MKILDKLMDKVQGRTMDLTDGRFETVKKLDEYIDNMEIGDIILYEGCINVFQKTGYREIKLLTDNWGNNFNCGLIGYRWCNFRKPSQWAKDLFNGKI